MKNQINKKRLFVFGDSWAFNYFSTYNKIYPDVKPHFGLTQIQTYVKYYNNFGHWLDYIDPFFDVYSYGLGGISNEQIIWQLSNLPEYMDGDRIIIIFTGVERYTWVHEKKRYTFAAGSHYPDVILDKKYRDFFKRQYVERYEYWLDNPNNNFDFEKKFLNTFPSYFKKYNPICVTWRKELSDQIESIDLLDFENYNLSTITDETNKLYIDGHLGAVGNYELFRYFANRLEVNIGNLIDIKKFEKQLL